MFIQDQSALTYQYDTSTMVRTWAQGSPKDICLVHGFFAHSYWWTWMMQDWSMQERVWAPDLRGMGHSRWSDVYSLQLHVASIAQQITSPTWLVGHSYGGIVCYSLSVLYPEKVKGLIMIDSPLKAWRDVADQLDNRRYHVIRTEYTDINKMKQAFVLMPKQEFRSKEMKDDLFIHSITKDDNGALRWLFDPKVVSFIYSYRNLDQEIGLIHRNCLKPILYIGAEHSDFSLPSDYGLLQKYAPHVDFVTIPHAFHAVMLDEPQVLQATIDTWIRAQQDTIIIV